MFIQITIDGTSGVGKSTLAKSLASSLNYTYINSGLIFRGIAWYMIKNPKLTIEEIINTITKYKHFYFNKNKWFLNEKEIKIEELISSEISNKSSEIAKNLIVRNYALSIEREEALKENIIMDGRDIGTTVFPDARLKIFLTGSLEVRANRRYKELKEKGILGNLTLEDIKLQMYQRDKQDSERKNSPLKKAEDAISIDVDNYSIPELTDKVIKLLEAKNAEVEKLNQKHHSLEQ